MKSEDIKKIVEYVSDNVDCPERAVLIDGPWGCGKTYAVTPFINNSGDSKKDEITPKIYYVSLFGADNIDEVGNKLRIAVNGYKTDNAQNILNISSTILHSMPYFNILGGIADGLSTTLDRRKKNLKNIKFNENVTIIFDDVERVKENFQYRSFLGFLNDLIVEGAKVICICNSEQIINKDDFMEFKEKVFDRIYKIDEAPNSVLLEIFKDLGIDYFEINSLNMILNNNIRIAQKVRTFVDNVIEILKEDKIDYLKRISNITLVRCCLYAYRISLEDNELSADNGAQISDAIHMTSSVAASALKSLEQRQFVTFFENNYESIVVDMDVLELTACLVHLYLFDNKEYLIDYFDLFKGNDIHTLSDLPYLSYQDNESFSNKYIDDICSGAIEFKTNKDIVSLYNFLSTTVIFVDEKTEKKIENAIVKNVPSLDILESDLIEQLKEKTKISCPQFSKIINQSVFHFRLLKFANEEKQITKLYKNKEYFKLNGILAEMLEAIKQKNPNYNVHSRLVVIRDNNYFLTIDLSQTIDRYYWNCCLITGQIVAQYDKYRGEYESKINQMKYETKDDIAKRRIETLISNFNDAVKLYSINDDPVLP